MLKPFMLIFIINFSAACTNRGTIPPFGNVLNGSSDVPNEVRVVGFVDTQGVNFYSLFSDRSQRNGINCIPLILNRRGQSDSKRLSGRKVEVAGNVIPMADLNEAIPTEFGQVNRRDWSGTRCNGQAAIYVKRMRSVSE
jgi:hypothetical protein